MTLIELPISPDALPDLARLPNIDSVVVINKLENEIALEITYTCRDYQGMEANSRQYEMMLIVDISTGTIKHRSLASPIETDIRKFKVHSPTGRYTIVGYKRQQNPDPPQLSLDVISTQLSLYCYYHTYPFLDI